jgi:predicted RNase H-like HicB family nuclease
MKFPVIVDQSEYGFDVHCPALKGCNSQGDTLEEALANIKDAIEQYLDVFKEMHRDSKIYEVEIAV